MPFDPQTKRLTGIDARRPKTWATDTFCAWLEALLNDADGPYAAALGLNNERKAKVTKNQEIGAALYGDAKAPPVVIVRRGITQRGVNGRVEMQFQIDMGVSDITPDDDDVEAELDADEMLVDFVSDAIENNYQVLADIGLNNTELTADAERQRAGNERNPHTLTFFVRVQTN